MRLRDEDNTTTLFQFQDADEVFSGTAEAVVLDGSLGESFSFVTKIKKRWALKDLVKREAAVKNRTVNLKILFIGSSRDSLLSSFVSVFEDNEFVYLDTEGAASHIDGVYAPDGKFKTKPDALGEYVVVDMRLLEKEA